MQMHTEQMASALIHELFHSRRLVVGLFVALNVAALALGSIWPKSYTASTSILVDERNIVQPLMQGTAVPTEVADRGRNAREVIFGRKIMDRILENGGWLASHPNAEEKERLIEEIKKRTTILSAGRTNRRPLLDLLDQALLLLRVRMTGQPSAVFEDAIHDLSAKDHFARVSASVGNLSWNGGALHKGLNDVPLIHQDAG